jgi:hypothetical protein
MKDDNYYQYPGPNRGGYDEKVRPNNFLQRNRLFIIIISVLVVLLAIFASATFFLLTTHQEKPTIASTPATPTSQVAAAAPTSATAAATPTPADTPTPALNATVTTSASSTSSITTTSKNYQFICLTSCDAKFDVLLNAIVINTTNKTMDWNFTITNNGNICSNMYGSLSLEPPSGDIIKGDGGTFLNGIGINSSQALPRTATFSMIPAQGTQYTATLQVTCSDSTRATYQSVLFSY